MFGLFRPRGFDALPTTFVDALRERVGERRLATLGVLGRDHGLFRQRFFHQPRAHFDDVDTQLRRLAATVAALADRLGQRQPAGRAGELYELALAIQPDLIEAHQGLAVLDSLQGRTSEAAGHARAALRALRGARRPGTDDELRAQAVLARVLAEAHLEERLGKEALARARDLAADHDLRGRAAALYAAAILEIADSGSPEAFTAYRRLFADRLVDAAHDRAGTPATPADGDDRTHPMARASAASSSDVLELLQYARALYPEHLDAWIFAATFRGRGVDMTTAMHRETAALAREALALLSRLQYGEDEVFTKDPSLLSSDRKQMRKRLEGLLRGSPTS